MSCLRYSSLTIFCTFPLFVDLTKTLLEMFEAYGSASDRFKLVIIAMYTLNETKSDYKRIQINIRSLRKEGNVMVTI